jgi:hypothetical protein
MNGLSSMAAIHVLGLLVVTGSACGPAGPAEERPEAPAQRGPGGAALSEAEWAEGWQILFDGRSLEGWRGFGREDVPDGWQVSEDGAIHFTRSDGDINTGLITEERFDDFELRLDWKVAPLGNSGIFFRVTEDEDAIWKTGPEYQVVDNVNHPDGQRPESSAGSNYGLHGPDQDHARPAGEWNEARIAVHGADVEHWLNGQKVVEYDLWSEDWERRVAASPFRDVPAYGRSRTGHIALQEGGPVWYRNIRIRRLE